MFPCWCQSVLIAVERSGRVMTIKATRFGDFKRTSVAFERIASVQGSRGH